MPILDPFLPDEPADFDRFAAGLAFLNTYAHVLTGKRITNVGLSVHEVTLHLDTAEEAAEVAAALYEAVTDLDLDLDGHYNGAGFREFTAPEVIGPQRWGFYRLNLRILGKEGLA